MFKKIIAFFKVRKKSPSGDKIALLKFYDTKYIHKELDYNFLDMYKLSTQDRKVLAVFMKKNNIKKTAEVLHRNIHAIQTHLKNTYKKLGLHSLKDLRLFVYQNQE